MRSVRFYCDGVNGDRAVLDPAQSRHLAKVLRLGIGQAVEVFDGRGLLAEAVVERIGRSEVELRLTKTQHTPPKSSGRVILAVSMAKGERFDWMVEKCTELGADHIAAVQYDRTVKMGKQTMLERLGRITQAAAKQCGRIYLPTLSGPDTLEATLVDLLAAYPQAELLCGDPDGAAISPAKQADEIVCIGPEGGFSESEYRLLDQYNARRVCVNSNTLRIETAAVAFSAVLCRV